MSTSAASLPLSEPLAAAAFLALVVLALGLTLPLQARRPASGLLPGRALLGLLLVQWLLIPGLTLAALSWALPAEARGQGLALALLVVAVTPGGKGSLAFALLAGAEVALILAAALLALALTAVLTPAWLALGVAATVTVPVVVLLEAGALLLAATVLPLAAGLWVQRRRPRWRPPLLRGVQALIALAVLLALVQAAAGLDRLQPPGGWPALGLVVVLTHGLVLLTGELAARALGLPRAQRRALVLAVGVHNSALALPLVLLLAPGDSLAFATVALWGLWRLLAVALLSLTWSRRQPPPVAVQEAQS